MSKTKIPESVKIRLWGKAAGRCQYAGCNKPLWLDALTKAEFNTAYIAHIIADEPDGPRGDPILSKQLAKDIGNLMLACDAHHRLIDIEDEKGHPVVRLRKMKEEHERRIERLGAITEEKRSHILLYGARIGEHNSPLSYAEAAWAMSPKTFPAESQALTLGLGNSALKDSQDTYWAVEAQQLRAMMVEQVYPRLRKGEIRHLSVFALAPQPLLMLLGSLLSDLPAARVYQRRREPATWAWEEEPSQFRYDVAEPSNKTGTPALVFSLSATVTDDRITKVLGENAAIWRVTIPTPNTDFVKSEIQLAEFRAKMRVLMDRMKAVHGSQATIHVFPAMPVSLAVEFGRIRMPKADLPLVIYDENTKLGGFTKALEINAQN